jgi:hypothetical protein
MMLRPTESRLLWLQQFGRGFRKADAKADLNLIDYIGNQRTFLLKPQTLFQLPPGAGAIDRTLNRVLAGDADQPPGCEVVRTPSVNAGFSMVILLTAQYAPSSSLNVGICSFNPDISAYWRTRNSSESPHKSPHSLSRVNDNPDPRFLSPCLAPPRGYIGGKPGPTTEPPPSRF